MGIRKNAKFLDSTEQENFVKACVLMKADIVNPAAPADQQYTISETQRRWDLHPVAQRLCRGRDWNKESTPKSSKKSPTVKGKSKK